MCRQSGKDRKIYEDLLVRRPIGGTIGLSKLVHLQRGAEVSKENISHIQYFLRQHAPILKLQQTNHQAMFSIHTFRYIYSSPVMDVTNGDFRGICIYQPCVVQTLQGCSRRTWARGECSRLVDGFSKKKQ